MFKTSSRILPCAFFLIYAMARKRWPSPEQDRCVTVPRSNVGQGGLHQLMTPEIDPRPDRGDETSRRRQTWTAALVSVPCFLWAGYAATTNKVNSTSQWVVFLLSACIGGAGLIWFVASMGDSKVSVNLRWLKATGVCAIVFALLLILLQALHVTNLAELTGVSNSIRSEESSRPENTKTLLSDFADFIKELRGKSSRETVPHRLKPP